MEYNTVRFEDIPSEIHAKIFEYLTTKELLRTIARASKDYARLLEDALVANGAAPNSSNILITGMNGAGCTTLTTRLKEALGVDNTLRGVTTSGEVKSVRVNDNNVNVFGVQLNSCLANVWHASTRPRQRKMMFQYYGISQLVVFAVPSQVTANNKKDLKEALLALYSLAGHTNWIIVVNKMDLVQFSEQEYNNTIAAVKKCARKIMGQHVDQLTFVPMTANDTSRPVTSTSVNVSWYHGPSFLSELNSRAVQFQVPAVKLVKKLNMCVVSVFRALTQPTLNPKDSTVVLSAYVLDGILRVGDTVEVYPSCSAAPSRNYMAKKFYNLWAFAKVLEIQYLYMSKQYALPNSYVGVKVQFSNPAVVRPRYHHLQNVQSPTAKFSVGYSFITYQGLFNTTLVHVANKNNFNRKWDGLVKQGYSGGFATVSLRGLMTVERITKIFDKDGNEQDLTALKAKRGSVGLERGEKAEAVVRVWCPMSLVFKQPDHSYNYPDSYGRLIIYHDQSRVVLVGVIHSPYTKVPLAAQEFVNNAIYLQVNYKLTL